MSLYCKAVFFRNLGHAHPTSVVCPSAGASPTLLGICFNSQRYQAAGTWEPWDPRVTHVKRVPGDVTLEHMSHDLCLDGQSFLPPDVERPLVLRLLSSVVLSQV